MGLYFDAVRLEEVLRAFYTLSGIRVILFDTDYREVMAFPEKDGDFCAGLKRHPVSCEKCRESDLRSFQDCTRNDGLMIYKCHAGLVEAAVPLKENGVTMGYAMFGQITDQPDKAALQKQAAQLCRVYAIPQEELLPFLDRIAYKSYEQIRSAAKILEACTSYILVREMVAARNDRLLDELDRYVSENLNMDISIPALCDALKVSRTKLYKVCGSSLKNGIADYIRTKRLGQARFLLKSTRLPVSEIAAMVGFSDYNYFSRVFRQVYGQSPKEYRKE